ncbi:Ribosomal RNA small subunit methyltransferase J [Buchnera aphidicola (Thelaxes suberi)]|uniref:class I SAM-dependent methyltransferase n=1 Tax=Buchnera aphidicola TaxID=9 RepID=UPI0034649AF2
MRILLISVTNIQKICFYKQNTKRKNMYLIIQPKKNVLFQLSKNTSNYFYISFTKKNFLSRIQNTQKKEAIAKAVGIKKNYYPIVLDATAGLGRDSIILASLGCTVIMFERNPIISFLLNNALKQAINHPIIGPWIQSRIMLIQDSSFKMLEIPEIPQPDVIYLDPMLNLKNNKSKPKKGMQFLKKIIGDKDTDANKLFQIAKNFAKKRIVVKRPLHYSRINKTNINASIITKQNRFDIYYINNIKNI